MQQQLIGELRRTPGRIRTSVRMAFITAVGAALTAALHIDSVLGLAALCAALYTSKSLLTLSEAVLMLLAYAIMLSASIPLAGTMVEAPWILLPFYGLATAVILYILNKYGLAGAWFVVAVGFLDTYYLCVFDPQNFGWSVAYTFAGVALTIGLLLAFDNVLWPDPAERRLLRSLADTLDRERRRLNAIGSVYLDPHGAPTLHEPAVVSILPTQLPLLERARRELKNPAREAVLLAAVTTTERLHIEVERLLAISHGSVARDIRRKLQPETEAVLQTLSGALREQAHQAATGLLRCDPSNYEEIGTAIGSSLDALLARETLIFRQLSPADATAIATVAAFNQGLRKIGERLLHRPLGYVYGLVLRQDARGSPTNSASADRALMRYSAKLGIAATLGYVVGLTAHRGDLGVIVWTTIFAGMPTYGATMRKMMLRIVGGLIGGLLVLAVIIVVSPNFESIGSYLAAFFVAMFLCAYASLSSGRVAHAGQQAGFSFVFAYVALSPNSDVFAPLWRVWGIFLGLLIVGSVFLLVAPEYAGKALWPRLHSIVQGALELLRPLEKLTEQRLQQINLDAALQCTQLMGIADDARLEGRHCGVDPDCVIEASGTLQRIVQRLSVIDSGRLFMPQLAFSPKLLAARTACDDALRDQLQSWLEFVVIMEGQEGDPRRAHAIASRRPALNLAAPVATLQECLAEEELATWPAAARSLFLAELEHYRRLTVLARELEQHLMNISGPQSG